MITRENYEIWFMNYLDGQLDADELVMLQAFLSRNPDLEKELEGIDGCDLMPVDISFDNKKALIKGDAEGMGIPNVDYLLVKQLEEGLSSKEEVKLNALIMEDSALLTRSETYKRTILFPEEVLYPRKKTLFKKRMPLLRVLRPVAAAAVVLMLVPLWQWFLPQFPVADVVPARIASEVKPFLLPTGETLSLLSGTQELVVPEKEQSEVVSVSENEVQIQSSTVSINRRDFEDSVNLIAMVPRSIESVSVSADLPNAYEVGLKVMMPLFLELNYQSNTFLADAANQSPGRGGRNLLNFGLEVMDKLTGGLVQFKKVYDDQGNYVAYNLQTPVFAMENLRAKEKRRGDQ